MPNFFPKNDLFLLRMLFYTHLKGNPIGFDPLRSLLELDTLDSQIFPWCAAAAAVPTISTIATKCVIVWINSCY
jgi:hypothetical protein